MKSKFKTWELLPWELWLQVGEVGRLLVDPVLLQMLELLRADVGKAFTVNTKGHGGYNSSCVRLPEHKHYKPGSRHSLNRQYNPKCCAVDFRGDFDPREIHARILKNPERYPHIRFLEIDISWVHIDTEQRKGRDGVSLWSPTRSFVEVATYIQELKENGFW